MSILLAALLAAWTNRAAWRYIFLAGGVSPGAITSDVLALGAVGAYLYVCLRLGRRILARMALDASARPERRLSDLTAFTLGIGATAVSVAVLGAAHLFKPWAAWSLAALWLALAAGACEGSARRSDRAAWNTLLGAALLYAAWNALVRALAPPTEWDALAYHLAVPKIYWTLGGIVELPWLLHSHWPRLIDTLYAFPIAAGLYNAPALIHAALCAALVGSVFYWARAQWGERAAWVSAAALAAQPVFLDASGWPHHDGALALFHLQALMALWTWRATRRTPWLYAAAIFSGLAASSKLLGAIPFVSLALLAGAAGFPKRREFHWKAFFIFLAVGGALAAPWYAKSWLAAGNPVWPFLPRVFGGKFGADWVIHGQFLDREAWAWPPRLSVLLNHQPQYLLVPAALLGAWAAALPRRLPASLVFFLAPTLPYALCTWGHNEFWRFFLPMMPAFALVIGWGAQVLLDRGRAARLGAAAAVAFALWPLAQTDQNNELFAVLGARSSLTPGESPKDAYLERSLSSYAACRWINASLPADANILLFREIRGFYLDRDYLWGDPLDQGLIRYDRLANPQELYALLRSLGVTHVLVNEAVELYGPSASYYTPRTIALMNAALREQARPVFSRGLASVYELVP